MKMLDNWLNVDSNDPLTPPMKTWEKVVTGVVVVLVAAAAIAFWHVRDKALHEAYGERYAKEVQIQK